MSGLLCSGNVHIAVLGVNDAFTGFAGVRNTVKLTITEDGQEKIKRNSRMVANFGQVLDSVTIPGGLVLSLDFDDIDSETIGFAVLGSVASANVTGASAATFDLVDMQLGKWYKLPHRFTTVTDVATGTVTPTSLTTSQYQVDVNAGMIRIIDGAANGDLLTVTYDYASVTASAIPAGTKQSFTVRIYGTMRNLVTGKDIVLDIPKVVVAPAEPIDWLSGEFAVAKLLGDIISIGTNPPYTVTVDS